MLGRDIGCPVEDFYGFPLSLQENTGRDRFLPKPLELIICLSTYHPTPYNLNTESVFK
jgi:hypothetical protein